MVHPEREAAAPTPGLSLAHYAAVKAAVTEGFPLEDVLDVEGLSPRPFARADIAWKQQLAADARLMAAYAQDLARAEDWLDRRIDPLSDDAAAWVSFLAAFEAHPVPFELLKATALGMNDISRLQRRWARRIEGDPNLAKQIAEQRGRPGKLTLIRAAPRVLRPSKWSRARPEEQTEHVGTAGVGVQPEALVFGLAEYAALCAELEVMADQRARVLQRHGLASEDAHAELARRWGAELERDRALARDFQRLRGHHEQRLKMLLSQARRSLPAEATAPLKTLGNAPPVEPPAAPAATTVPAARSGTALALEIPPGPVLPFVATKGEIAIAKAEMKAPRAADSITGTALALDVPRGPELPFQGAASTFEVKRPPSAIAGTSPVLDIPRGPELPFARDSQGAGATVAGAAQSPLPAPKRAPEALVETSPAVNVPRVPALPFGSAASGPPTGASPLGTKAAQAMPVSQGTSPMLDLPRGDVLPFAAGTAATKPTSTSALPAPARSRPAEALGETSLNLNIPRELLQAFARTSVTEAPKAVQQNVTPSSRTAQPTFAPASAVDVTLTLEQYAALCAELAVSPGAGETIFRRYGLDSKEKRSAVDSAWKERFRREPLKHREWQELYLRYQNYWMGRGR